MPIRLLPDEVSSQIAAGEVVERPASVVKELVENALDAGAGQIDIVVEGAGKRLIQVADNGCGIPFPEMHLAVARHATSKLSNAQDLQHINTLGFRGEALASIGSVSRLTVTSHTEGALEGACLKVFAGQIESIAPAGAPRGTLIRVEDLFFSVPARLKFLKTDSTERQQIDTLISRYATAYPGVRFRLEQDGRISINTSGTGNRREALASIYGIDFARQLLETTSTEEGFGLEGFISPIHISRSNRREIIIFVNGRLIQDAGLSAAFVRAYQTLLMVGRYPLGYLFIQIPPEEVDVNVHPAKAEVRFRSPDMMFSRVQRTVRRTLMTYSPIPQVETPRIWQSIAPDGGTSASWETVPAPAPAFQPSSQEYPETLATSGELAGRLPLLRLVGQIGAAYLVAEGPDGLYLVDQHAAHERVLFERYFGRTRQPIPAQTLLQPEAVKLSPQAARLLDSDLPMLDSLGYLVDPFGPDTYLIRAVPAIFTGIHPQAALQILLEDFEEDETPLQAELTARLAARICKRAAVKAGQVLSSAEQTALVRDLETCLSPRTCPHGRPTMIHLSVDLLERQFGRRGAR